MRRARKNRGGRHNEEDRGGRPNVVDGGEIEEEIRGVGPRGCPRVAGGVADVADFL